MRVKSLRAWQRFINEVHQGLTAQGLDVDAFSVDDLLHLHRCAFTPQRVVDLALVNQRRQEAAQA